MKRKCKKCNGTGVEPCEVHGSHPCDLCNGKGCIEDYCIPPPRPGLYTSKFRMMYI